MKLVLMPLAIAIVAAGASAQTVKPPPLPIGAQQARPEAGLHLEERKRHVRAHRHKFHHKKDYTRDDSVHGELGDPRRDARDDRRDAREDRRDERRDARDDRKDAREERRDDKNNNRK